MTRVVGGKPGKFVRESNRTEIFSANISKTSKVKHKVPEIHRYWSLITILRFRSVSHVLSVIMREVKSIVLLPTL